jgi:transcriptional regulator with XRE-family HTH domain
MYAGGFYAGASENVQPMRRSERPQPALGEAVRQLRDKNGATQEALARDAGITTATLSLIERGQANPTWDTLKKITAGLGTSMGALGRLADKLEAD